MFVIRREDVYQDEDGIWRYIAPAGKVVSNEVLRQLSVHYSATEQSFARARETE